MFKCLIVGAPETTPTEGALTTRTEDIEEAELVTEPEKPTDPETPKRRTYSLMS